MFTEITSICHCRNSLTSPTPRSSPRSPSPSPDLCWRFVTPSSPSSTAAGGSSPSWRICSSPTRSKTATSFAKNFHGPSGSYSLLAGKDASSALAKMSKEESDVVPDLYGLSGKEIGVLEDWEKKFQAKYQIVGTASSVSKVTMSDLSRYMRACFQSGKLAMLAILVSGGIVLQILACALYNNWWPMLAVLMYILLPMPLLFFVGSDASSLYSETSNGWLDATKFLTGASVVGSIAIPVILKHAGVISWGALAMDLSSFVVFVMAVLCYLVTSEDDGYSSIY